MVSKKWKKQFLFSGITAGIAYLIFYITKISGSHLLFGVGILVSIFLYWIVFVKDWK